VSGKGKAYVDGMLVDWGAALFNEGPVSASPRGSSAAGLLKRRERKAGASGGVLKKGGPGAVSQSAATIRSKLGAIARRTPEVMVKITPGAPKGMRQIKRHLDYISRKGEIPLEDQDGDVIVGKLALEQLRDDWQHGGAYIADEPGRFREAFHIVFSMPEGTDELAVKRAVRDFAAREFEGHQYVMAMHTFDTDPDPEPSKHPHVHLAVKARGDDLTRLSPRKADLQRWREGFAAALREHGVEAAATNRLQRLKRERSEKQAVRQIRDSGRALQRVGRSPVDEDAKAASIAKESQVYGTYRKLVEALSQSEDAEDRKLAVQVVARLAEDREAARQRQLSEQRADRSDKPPER
jgi:hypothetical protein